MWAICTSNMSNRVNNSVSNLCMPMKNSWEVTTYQTWIHGHCTATESGFCWCSVLFVLLNLILCLHKGLYSINSLSIHSLSNLTICQFMRACVRVSARSVYCVFCVCVCVTEWKWKFFRRLLVCLQPLSFRSVPHCIIWNRTSKDWLGNLPKSIQHLYSSDCMSHQWIERRENERMKKKKIGKNRWMRKSINWTMNWAIRCSSLIQQQWQMSLLSSSSSASPPRLKTIKNTTTSKRIWFVHSIVHHLLFVKIVSVDFDCLLQFSHSTQHSVASIFL